MNLPLLGNLRQKLIESIKALLIEEQQRGKINDTSKTNLNYAGINVTEPRNKSFGDLSTNAAMVLAPVLKQDPSKIAETIIEKIISRWEESDNIRVAAPGFINFSIKSSFIQKQMKVLSGLNEKFGENDFGNGTKIQIEFVSANPTGNLHIGHGRWAALGDSLSNIYQANGYDVCREYYVNDYGSQIDNFALCLSSLYLKTFNIDVGYPKDGYPEEIVKSVVEEIIENEGERYLIKSAAEEVADSNSGVAEGNGADKGKSAIVQITADKDKLGRTGAKIMLGRISSTLFSMGVKFDRWFMESSLYKDANFDRTVLELKEKDLIYQKDNALWFRAEKFGDEKDRVVIRTSGEPTYFASDILYMIDKVSRGFKKLIYILGADHHGYVKRLHAIAKAVGFDDNDLNVIIGQLVRLVKKGQAVRMSKRKGKIYNLEDLIKEVGPDAIRYFFSANSFDTPMDFDIGLAKQKSNTNPVYYLQYAHARIANVIEKVAILYSSGKLIFDRAEFKDPDFKSISRLVLSIDFGNLQFANEAELNLAKTLLFYPDIVRDACSNNAPHLVSQYLYRLASGFHYFYKHNRIIDKEKLNSSRFKLILLVRTVLSNAMKLLKISTPIKM